MLASAAPTGAFPTGARPPLLGPEMGRVRGQPGSPGRPLCWPAARRPRGVCRALRHAGMASAPQPGAPPRRIEKAARRLRPCGGRRDGAAALRCVAKWDVDTGACELRLRRHALGVRALARLDAHAVLSGSLDMTVRAPHRPRSATAASERARLSGRSFLGPGQGFPARAEGPQARSQG